MSKRILILGGTRDARRLAGLLVDAGYDVTSSLAGVTGEPAIPAGALRTGGFGGADGLANYLTANNVDVVADATHPFAAQISRNAAEAAQLVGVRLVRLERPAWEQADDERWTMVATVSEAVVALKTGECALVTIGRKDVSLFAARQDVRLVARMIEPPEADLPDGSRLILARPPFSLDDEADLMRDEGVDVLVSKNAGGPGRAKLDAARALGIPAIMIDRPELPSAETVPSPEALVEYLGEN